MTKLEGGARRSFDEWPIVLAVGDLPKAGITFAGSLPSQALDALAFLLDGEVVSAVVADVTVQHGRRKTITVDGTFEAHMSRTCVVSLDEFGARMAGVVVRRYTTKERPPDRNAAVTVDVDAPDPPDPVPIAGIDIGAILFEEIALEFDPYPRKPGVAFSPPDDSTRAGEAGVGAPSNKEKPENPFDVLRALTGEKDGKNG